MEKFRINLQLFADPNTQTTELSTVGNNLSPEMKTFYSKDLIEMLGANLVHLQFGDPVSLPKHGGKTIEWRKWTKFEKALKTGVKAAIFTSISNVFGYILPIEKMADLCKKYPKNDKWSLFVSCKCLYDMI